ncbi:HTH domain-containing protein [Croceitalea vernalis]|uniref:HTH domain-containing protein n=1 Tax=Croceitalea vernalis TaxID=3075599 RepID=A0ABU3BH25_9FLAO|nr:HTH domain-containing protein [Croceitalea sp. P007]MDT0621430.1 HTH domain-containing protein [Croceitalea sp. P007]
MKQLTKQIALLERMDQLVRLKATGRPKQLAERLEVSEATVFRMIETMKELNAPIYYDLARQSYSYSEPTAFKCGFFLKSLDEQAQRNLTGGIGFENIKRLLKF